MGWEFLDANGRKLTQQSSGFSQVVSDRFLHSYIYPSNLVTTYLWATGGLLLDEAADFTADGFYVFDLTDGQVALDPGWIDPNTYEDTEIDWDCIFPANTTLVLPVGVYQWTFRVKAEPAVDSGAYWADMALLGPPSAAGLVSASSLNAVVRDAKSHAGQPASLQLDPRDSTSGGLLAVDTNDLHAVPYLSTEGNANGSNPTLLELSLVRL